MAKGCKTKRKLKATPKMSNGGKFKSIAGGVGAFAGALGNMMGLLGNQSKNESLSKAGGQIASVGNIVGTIGNAIPENKKVPMPKKKDKDITNEVGDNLSGYDTWKLPTSNMGFNANDIYKNKSTRVTGATLRKGGVIKRKK